MTEKRKGRFPLPEHLKKKEVIQTNITEKQKESLEKIAKKVKKPVSVYIRENLIIPLLKDVEKEE